MPIDSDRAPASTSAIRADVDAECVSPDDMALPMTDAALIEAVATGDSRAARQFYDRLIRVVDRTLFRIFRRREPDHDDLVQATFEQLVLTLVRRRFAGGCSLTSWASCVASHVGLNSLRTKRRERLILSTGDEELLSLAATVAANVEHEVGVRKEVARVRSHLAEMGDAKSSALLMHDVYGHNLAEIAARTGVSLSAAQSRLVRGRKELFARLEIDGRRDGAHERASAKPICAAAGAG